MCPCCKEHDGKICKVTDKPDGRLTCECGRHSWPNAGTFFETCRQQSLTATGRTHIWTQGY
jgi:hypothetical protein